MFVFRHLTMFAVDGIFFPLYNWLEIHVMFLEKSSASKF